MLNMDVRVIILLLCSASVIQAFQIQSEKKKGADDCPNSEAILPCECKYEMWLDQLEIRCDEVTSEDELRNVFNATFPVKKFDIFRISNNKKLKVLESNVFNGIAFTEFYFNHNVLDRVDIKAFEDSSEILDNINLQYNNITKVSFETQKSFPTLRRVYLTRNKLKAFNFASLKNFPYLSIFDIDFNPLSTIPIDSFQRTSLSTISLSGTVNKFIPGTFSNQTRLNSLWVESNNIKHIPSGLFVTGSSHFNTLFLNSNGIISVDSNAFDLNYNLRIHMGNNSLTRIDESVWREPFDAGVSLDLSDDNPLECGCDVAWIVNDPALMLQVSVYTVCADGRPFIELLLDDFVNC